MRPGRIVYPAHWSFLLGEVAVVTFVVLVATGIPLALVYRPSIEPVVYSGAAELYDGQTLPAAFASVVRISNDLPGGLLLRRLHAVAAHVFVLASVGHLLRVLLTGAFRWPRAGNYGVGVALLLLALGMGFTGQNLPFELLAGTSLRVTYAYIQSVPYVGEQLALLLYGGVFPTGEIIPRLWVLHVFLLPAVFSGGLAAHLLLVVRRSHTQLPRDGVDATRVVVGRRLRDRPARRSATLAFVVAGVLAASAALVPWADVELEGPYRVAQTANTLQPDWYLFWPEGTMRILPAFTWHVLGATISNRSVGVVFLPMLLIGLLAAYPLLERRLLAAGGDPHALQHPLDVPVRLGLVTGWFSLVAVMSLGAADDVIAEVTGVPLEAVVRVLRVALVAVPPLAGWLAYRYARGQPQRWPHS